VVAAARVAAVGLAEWRSSFRADLPIDHLEMGEKAHIPAAVCGARPYGLGLGILVLTLGLAACGLEPESSDPHEQQTSTETAVSVVPTTATATATATAASASSVATSTSVAPPAYARPDRLCGRPGFAYLLSVYFYPQCSKCHGGNDFAGADPDVSWPRMQALDEQKLINVVLTGQFCVDKCRLREGDATLADIRAWQAEKSECP
jgi:hypothetical protein